MTPFQLVGTRRVPANFLIGRMNEKFQKNRFSGSGIAESRNPQMTQPSHPPVVVDKTKNKQGTFPWLVNLAGPPGTPGNSFATVSSVKY